MRFTKGSTSNGSAYVRARAAAFLASKVGRKFWRFFDRTLFERRDVFAGVVGVTLTLLTRRLT